MKKSPTWDEYYQNQDAYNENFDVLYRAWQDIKDAPTEYERELARLKHLECLKEEKRLNYLDVELRAALDIEGRKKKGISCGYIKAAYEALKDRWVTAEDLMTVTGLPTIQKVHTVLKTLRRYHKKTIVFERFHKGGKNFKRYKIDTKTKENV